jgi:transposase InsO family protein
MPWKVTPMSELRKVLVHQVLTLKRPMAEVCREHGVSRKTGYKWLVRHRLAPDQPLTDQSRRPVNSPRRTPDQLAAKVAAVRRQYRWGARKIRAYLAAQGAVLPTTKTVHEVLRRQGLLTPPTDDPAPPQRFVRSQPNELWQCDHKGPLEIARQKVYPLSVLDDHSRFLLALEACLDVTMKTAFDVLWNVFGEYGLPDGILCDNAFGTNFSVPKTPSWFDAQLIRLGIQPLHGKPYHPQTQGKVERLHGTLEREVWPFVRRDALDHFAEDTRHWRSEIYNLVRPHEALADRPPVALYRPSLRRRPTRMPAVEYPAGSVLRKVSGNGEVFWKNNRILAGNGLAGEYVRIEERDCEIALFYCWKEVRRLAHDQLRGDKIV